MSRFPAVRHEGGLAQIGADSEPRWAISFMDRLISPFAQGLGVWPHSGLPSGSSRRMSRAHPSFLWSKITVDVLRLC
jgi:hypothetical protein